MVRLVRTDAELIAIATKYHDEDPTLWRVNVPTGSLTNIFEYVEVEFWPGCAPRIARRTVDSFHEFLSRR